MAEGMRSALLLTLALEIGLMGCTSPNEQQEDCNWIGSINPLTGALGPVGLSLENAAKLAVQDVNRAGLVAGKKLCIATGDDRTNPDRAEAIVNALIASHDIRAVNGAAASSATLKAARAAEAANMAIVSCCSTSPELSNDPNIYRTVPSDALQGVALANLAKGQLEARNVAIIYVDNSYGTALKQEFEAAFASEGRVITNAVAYQERQSSYVDLVNGALSTATPPDHAVLIAYPVEGVQIIRDWKTSGAGRSVKWLGTDGLKDDTFVLAVGADVTDFEGTAPIPNGRFYEGFVERYRAAYGGEIPGIFTSNQYDAVILIALAIAKVGEPADPAMIRAAIPDISRPPGAPVTADDLVAALRFAESGAEIDYAGVSGEVDLDDKGDVVAGYRVWSIAPGGRGIDETNLCFTCGEGSGVSPGIRCDEAGCI